jgi:cytochrome c oxidase subunit 1
MVLSWVKGTRAAANPWNASTMEWQVSSPPPEHNFEGTPVFEAGPYEYGVPNAPAHGRVTPSGEHA